MTMIPVHINGVLVGEIRNQIDVGDAAMIQFATRMPVGHKVTKVYVAQNLKANSNTPKTINIATEPLLPQIYGADEGPGVEAEGANGANGPC